MPNWVMFARDINLEFGTHYQPDDLCRPEWVHEEIKRLGYVLETRIITKDEVDAKRRENGLAPMPEFRESFAYRLAGPIYESPGAHSSPLVPTLDMCCGTALYNLHRDLKRRRQ